MAERRFQRATDRVARTLGGIAWATSTPAERTQLGLALHDALEHRTTKASAGLFEWERRWYAEALPAPPARVLVGAAGSGREVLALLDAGYEVDAFEPAPQAWAALQANAGARARLWRLRYQELCDSIERGDGGGPEPGGYGAIVLGWSSLGCITDHATRARVLRACDSLAPRGPILASMPMASGPRRGLGRAGEWSGRWLGRQPPEGVVLVRSGGFMQPLTREEVEALGSAIGRTSRWGTHGVYPHVTWTPRASVG